MDAVKFIEERGRMCKAMDGDCNLPCPITNWCGRGLKRQADFAPDIVSAVEEWAAAHPRKTRQSVFLEQYPNAKIDSDGVIAICPNFLLLTDFDDIGKCAWVSCAKCRREFWMQEVE